MTIERHLTVGQFAHRPRILARDAHRVPSLFLKARIIKDQHPVPFAGQGLHLGDPLAVEGRLIPDHVGQQVLELLRDWSPARPSPRCHSFCWDAR